MAKKSKRYLAMLEKVDKTKLYGLREAIELLKELPTAKFDETVEMHIRLNVDPRHADQQVRGTITCLMALVRKKGSCHSIGRR